MLEVTNMERWVVQTQLTEMSQAIEYITEVDYHHFMVDREGSGEEQEGTVVPEM